MNGQKLRILTVVDDVSRECPVIAVDTSMTGRKVAAVLNQVNWFRPLPKEIKTNNGPENSLAASFINGVKNTRSIMCLASQAAQRKMGISKVLTDGCEMNA